jgi:hypothetical protein
VTHPKLSCVSWTDAHGNALTTFEAHEVPHAPVVVRTFGVIVKQDDVGITIASEQFETGSFRGVTFVPRGMILDVVVYHAAQVSRPRRRATPAPLPSSGAKVVPHGEPSADE